MAQFDIYLNPIEPERNIYPYVVQISSDFVSGTRARLTAPLSPAALTPSLKGVHPMVDFEGQEYVLETMSTVSHDSSDLRQSVGNLRLRADAIFNALDFVFHGY
jgi:hypothetical protein